MKVWRCMCIQYLQQLLVLQHYSNVGQLWLGKYPTIRGNIRASLHSHMFPSRDKFEHIWMLFWTYVVRPTRKLSPVMGQSSAVGAFPACMLLVYVWLSGQGMSPLQKIDPLQVIATWRVQFGRAPKHVQAHLFSQVDKVCIYIFCSWKFWGPFLRHKLSVSRITNVVITKVLSSFRYGHQYNYYGSLCVEHTVASKVVILDLKGINFFF